MAKNLDDLCQRAKDLIDYGKSKEALPIFDEILARDRNHAGALEGRADVLIEQARYPEALEAIERAHKLAPSPELKTKLARALELSGKHEEALRVVDELLAKHKTGPDLLMRGELLLELGRFEEARTALQQARREGDWYYAFEVDVALGLARAAIGLGLAKGALKELKEAEERAEDPRDLDRGLVHQLRALAHVLTGDTGAALDDLVDALAAPGADRQRILGNPQLAPLHETDVWREVSAPGWTAEGRKGEALGPRPAGLADAAFRGGSTLSGCFTGSLPKAPARRSLLRTPRPIQPSLAVCEQVLYLGCDDRHVYAIDLSTGQVSWRFGTGTRITAPPVVAGDLVCFGSEGDALRAIHRLSAEPAWKLSAKRLHEAPLVQHGGQLYGIIGGDLWAVDLATGKRVWKQRTDDSLALPAAVDASGVYYVDPLTGHNGNTLQAFDAQTGKRRWKRKGMIYDAPILAHDRVWIADEGRIVGLDPATGKERWASPDDAPSVTTLLAIDERRIYGWSDDGVFAVSRKKRETAWICSPPRSAIGPCAAAKGKLLFAALHEESATLHAVSAMRGEERWSMEFDAPISALLPCAGKIYVVAGSEVWELS
uniref:PQQ repeat protein n=1 Tax=Chondromyces catenulatus TaxID=1653841 RepID=A0A3S7UZF7_9BACT|nr:PQQ repeat protein [Chondromyces catenulatus]